MPHTLGKWTKEGDHIVARDDVGLVNNDGNSIAILFGPDEVANAALIAAAPELLQRLKEARDAIASLPDDALGIAERDCYQWTIKNELLSYIDDAIAKAGGAQ